jgi:hypothetical protein
VTGTIDPTHDSRSTIMQRTMHDCLRWTSAFAATIAIATIVMTLFSSAPSARALATGADLARRGGDTSGGDYYEVPSGIECAFGQCYELEEGVTAECWDYNSDTFPTDQGEGFDFANLNQWTVCYPRYVYDNNMCSGTPVSTDTDCDDSYLNSYDP